MSEPAVPPDASTGSAAAEPRVLRLNDPQTMRALAHPLRMKILGRLRTEGPATATTLASELGAIVPLVSYHLRQLARFGIVEEAPELARNARERPWRSSHDRTSWSSADFRDTPERMAADDALMREVYRRYAEQLDRFLDETPSWSEEWLRAASSSDLTLRLSPAQLEALREAMWELVERAARTDPGDSAEHVRVILHAFPIRRLV
jgi:DNA-binding transcriptional ArsR family regulator